MKPLILLLLIITIIMLMIVIILTVLVVIIGGPARAASCRPGRRARGSAPLVRSSRVLRAVLVFMCILCRYIYIYMHTCNDIYIYIYIYMYVCVYIYIYIYILYIYTHTCIRSVCVFVYCSTDGIELNSMALRQARHAAFVIC